MDRDCNVLGTGNPEPQGEAYICVINVPPHTSEHSSGKGKTGNCPELWDGKTAERIVEILAPGGYYWKEPRFKSG